MKHANTNLNLAKARKYDEYYTPVEMVRYEINHFTSLLRNKRVYCPCDSERSAFVQFFQQHYRDLGLAGLTYSSNDFRSTSSVQKMVEADVVITNPPFSIIKQFIDQLQHLGKQFLIVAPNRIMARSYIYPQLIDQKLWLGYGGRNNTGDKRWKFTVPDGTPISVGYRWLQNLRPNYRDPMNLDPTTPPRHMPAVFPRYDDHDAVDVRRVMWIPYAISRHPRIGVPLEFMDVWNPQDRFQIDPAGIIRPHLGGRAKFDRIFLTLKV